jgi:hypothetical protein
VLSFFLVFALLFLLFPLFLLLLLLLLRPSHRVFVPPAADSSTLTLFFPAGIQINTTEALEWALGHAIGVLQLNRCDALAVRFMVPAMMIRLGNDQEAYDFVKWWAVYGRRNHNYDWGDFDAPYLHLRGENMLEDVGWWAEEGEGEGEGQEDEGQGGEGEESDAAAPLADQVAILLIKLRLLLNRQTRIRQFQARELQITTTPEEEEEQEASSATQTFRRKDSAHSISPSPVTRPGEEYIRDRRWTARESSSAAAAAAAARRVEEEDEEMTARSRDEEGTSRSASPIVRLTHEMDVLQRQVSALLRAVHRHDRRLIPLLLAVERAPGGAGAEPMMMRSPASLLQNSSSTKEKEQQQEEEEDDEAEEQDEEMMEQVAVVLRYMSDAWAESTGALEWLRECPEVRAFVDALM